jgi:3-hydroxyisobutyrate dehydrogenase
VFCCVGNDDDLRSVVLGADGALAGMKAGAIFVDHTTASADVARELYAAARKAWACSLSTRPSRAARPVRRTALLTVMCGGDGAAFDAVKPVVWPFRAPSPSWAKAAPAS